jgi:hypothetical protein
VGGLAKGVIRRAELSNGGLRSANLRYAIAQIVDGLIGELSSCPGLPGHPRPPHKPGSDAGRARHDPEHPLP